MGLQRAIIAGCVVLFASATSGCFVGDENRWASPRQIADAAARCGLPAFKPTKVGDAWAAYVDRSVPGHEAKEDCIYADVERQGLLATR
ncbi:hypothetical protein [Caulobacter hibisci]|uniref:Lipoprotein n=1 Tax=Caulobacter hibisci TaxID=2035993 RepID=A0ABS0SZP8_9CAUL|nr:hypothetical protein [Caulobacter hibisci]MBI1685084.1 hypothetical protein [Caulobacter hibisci]